MKISFITTVLNEGTTIDGLLESLRSQTRKPDEIIIVDAGSADNTISVISNKKINIRTLVKRGNRSTGRNEAIKNSTGDIIVCTDAGCIPDKDWIKNLAKEFKNGVDVVSGYYKTEPRNDFEKALSAYTSVMPDRVDPKNFLPSSRSIAFKKSAWKRVGGYPNWLDTCEDLYFARELKNAGFKFAFARNAIVYWPQRKNFRQAASQFYKYAEGDGMARFFRPATPFLFGRYLFGFLLLALFIYTKSLFILILIPILLSNYILWAIFKNYVYVRSRRAYYLLPALQLISDFTVLTGTTVGFIKGFFIRK